jgi:hypothetical protein
MVNKFLETTEEQVLQGGSATLIGSSVGATNLIPGLTVKVDGNRQLQSTLLAISDTNGLQTILDSTITNPFAGTLEAADFKSDSIASISSAITDNATAITDKVSKAGDTITGTLNLTADLQQYGVTSQLPLQAAQPSNLVTGGGVSSALNLSTGESNVGYGNDIMNGLTTQSNNVAIGQNAMSNYIGNDSVAIGRRALLGNSSVSGQNNFALGTGVMERHTTGENCIGIGAGALFSCTTGSANIAIGTFCSDGITTETSTIAIGDGSRCDGFSNSIAIGQSAATTATNQMMIANTDHIVASSPCDLGSVALPFKDVFMSGSVNTITPVGGKYSQWAEITVGPITWATSLIDTGSENTGTATFQPTELTPGATFHIKCAGCFNTDGKEDATYSVELGGIEILNSGILEYADLNASVYAYELEIDIQVRATGASGSVYTNAQLIYIKNSTENSFRGNSVQQTQAIDLSSAIGMDVKWKWEDNSNDKSIINKMLTITRTY